MESIKARSKVLNIYYSKMELLEEKLRKGLYPLYKELLESDIFDDDVAAFCVQWGEEFPEKEKEGILFVGKATNGWLNTSKDVDVLFGNTVKRVFNRDDQMEWVNDQEGSNEGYDTNKSAFWRVVKKISSHFYQDKWYANVAWSNLYKLAPGKTGNPDGSLRYKQSSACHKIFKKEIELLSPKYVIMLTSSWGMDFLVYMNGCVPVSIGTESWGRGYETEMYEIDGTIYIKSFHPQGKSEPEHVEAIVRLLKSKND